MSQSIPRPGPRLNIQFPHASTARLRENAYTIVESTTHSLAVDVMLQDQSSIRTLFVSNSNGTFFVQSLKDTNRNEMGFMDYENLYGVEGVGLANVVANAQEVEGRNVPKQLKTLITFDDGVYFSCPCAFPLTLGSSYTGSSWQSMLLPPIVMANAYTVTPPTSTNALSIFTP
jgi:hypothetical protein